MIRLGKVGEENCCCLWFPCLKNPLETAVVPVPIFLESPHWDESSHWGFISGSQPCCKHIVGVLVRSPRALCKSAHQIFPFENEGFRVKGHLKLQPPPHPLPRFHIFSKACAGRERGIFYGEINSPETPPNIRWTLLCVWTIQGEKRNPSPENAILRLLKSDQ